MILSSLHSQLFQSRNDRLIRKWRSQVARIHQFDKKFESLEDSAIALQSAEWRHRLRSVDDNRDLGDALRELALEAFGLALQASRRLSGRPLEGERAWDMVFHDVQLIGGLAMHEGCIGEMATGEGKTLTATLPAYVAALAGRGVHVVTVNDYLAKRDAQWMGHLYEMLGVSVGYLQDDQDADERRAVYECDIVYGTASAFGFDYLRDHCVTSSSGEQVQREPFFALIDEIDSVLIDEARTPLVISGPATEDRSGAYQSMCPLVRKLVDAQRVECDRLLKDAKMQLGAGDEREAAQLLFQVQLAMPKHPRLRKLTEDPRVMRLVERESVAMFMDHRQSELAVIKEALLFSQDHRRRTVDLSERGCRFLSPDDVEAFSMPLDVLGHEERDPALQERAARIHAVNQLLRAFTLFQRDEDYHVVEGAVEIIDPERGRTMSGRRWNEGLHQAVEAKEGVEVQPETMTLATITLQNYFRLYPKLAGMTGTALAEEEEFRDVFGLRVASVPSHKSCLRVDHSDRVYMTQREKLAAVVAEIAGAHERRQPVLVGTAHVNHSEVLSRMLRRQGIPHRVLNAKRPAEEAEIIARAGRPGAVTVSTNMAGRGTDIRLAEGVAELGGLYVIGTERHTSSRVDLQLRGRSGRQGDPGCSRFFVSLEDELFKRFGHSERLMGWLERLGHAEGDVLEHSVLDRTLARAQKQLEEHHSKGRRIMLRMDDVLHAQRTEVYGWREEILTRPPRSLVGELLEESGEEDRVAMETAWDAHVERWGSVEPSVMEQIERQVLLGVLDRHWCEHLEWLEALKEDVFLEVIAQRDPVLEYRRRAYAGFEELASNIRRQSLQQLCGLRLPQELLFTRAPSSR